MGIVKSFYILNSPWKNTVAGCSIEKGPSLASAKRATHGGVKDGGWEHCRHGGQQFLVIDLGHKQVCTSVASELKLHQPEWNLTLTYP